MPVVRDILRYYLKQSAVYPIVLLAVVGLFFALRDIWRSIKLDRDASRVEVLGPALCLVYFTSPFCLYILSHLVKPLATGRYLIPYYLSLAMLCAYALDRIAHWLKATQSITIQRLAALLLAVGILSVHLHALHHMNPPASFDLTALRSASAGRPVVVQDEEAFFELQHYYSNQGLQFFFLLPPSQIGHVGLMGEVAQQGYYPGHLVPADEFESHHADFFVLAKALHTKTPWLPGTATCHVHSAGQVMVDGVLENLFEAQTCRQRAAESPLARLPVHLS